MTTKTLRWVLAASVITLAAAGGALTVSTTYASESEGGERGACVVKPNADGSLPAALSDADLRGKLSAAGYTQVRSLGHEDGCVEAKGLDKDGKRFEVYLHPATGEIVKQR